MKTMLVGVIIAFAMSFTAQAGLIATLQEGENNSVYFSIDVTNPAGFDYSSFNATHLDYIFFDNVGDYVKESVLGNNPTIFQPASHGLIGTSLDGFTIGIQAIALDNDDANPNDADDFVIRFIGQTAGLTNGVTPLNFEELVDFDPVLIRNLSFNALNVGSFSSTDAQSAALGGFSLLVKELVSVPVPATMPIFASGLLIMGYMSRRRRARSGEHLD